MPDKESLKRIDLSNYSELYVAYDEDGKVFGMYFGDREPDTASEVVARGYGWYMDTYAIRELIGILESLLPAQVEKDPDDGMREVGPHVVLS